MKVITMESSAYKAMMEQIAEVAGYVREISVYMDKNREVFMRILKGITKMLKRIKSLRGMETKQKCVVQRDEIIIPSTKNNDSIYLHSASFHLRFFIYRRWKLGFLCYFLCPPSAH